MALDFLKKKKTVEELEEEGDRLSIEAENTSREAEIAERKAIIAELKKKYGSSWAKTLGTNKWANISTLRSFLRVAKQGMEKRTSSSGGMPISRMYGFKGMPKA